MQKSAEGRLAELDLVELFQERIDRTVMHRTGHAMNLDRKRSVIWVWYDVSR